MTSLLMAWEMAWKTQDTTRELVTSLLTTRWSQYQRPVHTSPARPLLPLVVCTAGNTTSSAIICRAGQEAVSLKCGNALSVRLRCIVLPHPNTSVPTRYAF